MASPDLLPGEVSVQNRIDSDPALIRRGLLLTALAMPVIVLVWVATIGNASPAAAATALIGSFSLAFIAWRWHLDSQASLVTLAVLLDIIGILAALTVPLGLAFAVLLPSVAVAAMAGMALTVRWFVLAGAAWVSMTAGMVLAITIGPRASQLAPPAPGSTLSLVMAVGAFALLLFARASRRQSAAVDAAMEAAARSAESAAELARTRELLTAILAASPFSIVSVDSRGIVQYFNPAAERIIGVKAEEAMGKYVSDITEVTPDEYLEIYGRLVHGECVQLEPVRRKNRDGSVRDERSVIAPLVGADGSVAGAVTITEDVTERIHLEAELRQSQKMDTLGQLSGAIAHDFNNLLQAIRGYAELATASAEPNDEVAESLGEIRIAADRAAELTRQLLAFSQPGVAGARVVDVNRTIGESVPMIRRLVGPAISLSTVLDPEAGRVFIEPGQLLQVILNLAVNGRDAMPSGGSLAIQTTCPADSPGFVDLSVSDSGRGIPDDVRGRIFEPFFTTKEPGKGTGLGLTIVHSIVKSAGGEIAVESEAGKGTTFRLLLPIAEWGAPDLAETVLLDVRGNETILLVEDEDAIRRLAERVLKDHGYEVFCAANADEARRVWHERGSEVDLMLSDVTMPGLSGPALAAQLNPRPRTLFISGHLPNDPSVSLPAERTRFLQKPFTVAALLGAVRETLDSHSA
jgi:two-component system, cell cycle sensor histidine kinase and response regulator CckA